MLDYTKAALKKTVDDIKKILFIYTVLSLVLYIGYLIFASIFDIGVLPVNIILAIISAIYLCFYITVSVRNIKKSLSKRIKRIYKWSKISITAITLGIVIYGCVCNPNDTKGLVVTVILFLSWITQIILEFIAIAIANRVTLFQAALTKDFSPVIKIYNKITRTEDSEEDRTKQINALSKLLPEVTKKKGAKSAVKKALKSTRLGFFRKKKTAPETEAVIIEK